MSHHLGDRVSALADGHLDHDERDRALAHLARCDTCRSDVEGVRQSRAVLADLPAPVLPERLLESLLAIGSTTATGRSWQEPGSGAGPAGPAPPSRTAGAGDRTAGAGERTAMPVPSRAPGAGRPADRVDSRRPDNAASSRGRARTRAVRAAAAGLIAATAVTLGVASLGAPDGGTPPVAVVPPVERFTLEHARSTASLPFVESAALLVPVEDGAGQR
ncbi:MAG TPA: zf-HC2 domain-containing protein [Jiangellales bacterium]|nr:zf-HC2 domain-containing protein [Jiangellales bacterium]